MLSQEEQLPINKPEEQWIGLALHDLCQPLTALQCRLVIGKMSGAESPGKQLAKLRTAISESLIQCDRLMVLVRAMQNRIS